MDSVKHASSKPQGGSMVISAFQPYMFITDDHMGHVVRLRVKMNLHIHSDFPALTC